MRSISELLSSCTVVASFYCFKDLLKMWTFSKLFLRYLFEDKSFILKLRHLTDNAQNDTTIKSH